MKSQKTFKKEKNNSEENEMNPKYIDYGNICTDKEKPTKNNTNDKETEY